MIRNELLAYVLLIIFPVLVVAAVLEFGAGIVAPTISHLGPLASAATAPAPISPVLLLLQVALILLASRLIGIVFQKIGQPQVMGEIVAGILLGPSLFGWLAPDISTSLFPQASLGYLSAISQFGLILFMFLVGVRMQPHELKGQGKAALTISAASIAVPFCLGTSLALILYPRLSHSGVSFTNFALFMGCAMSITAFPVLARILAEAGLIKSKLGLISLSCAAINDVAGWTILAYLVVLFRSNDVSGTLPVVIGSAILYLAVVIVGSRKVLPGFEKAYRKDGQLTENAIAFMVVCALISAVVTEWLGVHALFGAFFLGAMMPKNEAFAGALLDKLEPLTIVVFLPPFFAYSGLRTDIGTLDSTTWPLALLVLFAAVLGKLGGTAAAAKLTGLPWREATGLGILMNTRGLMELVALNIGLDIGIISSTTFTIMVMMALATTLMTSPLLKALKRFNRASVKPASGVLEQIV